MCFAEKNYLLLLAIKEAALSIAALKTAVSDETPEKPTREVAAFIMNKLTAK